MPVQLDLFGAPLRPPKKIREDEAPAPAAPVAPADEKPASTPESYVAVIHPKDNKQGWQTITTKDAELPSEEQEDDATGVNEEAAIGQDAFVEEPTSDDAETAIAEQPLEEDVVAGYEAAEDFVEDEPAEEETIEETEEPVTEELETEGVEGFSEPEIAEPEEIAELEKEPLEEEFTDSSTDDFTDEEPDTYIDGERSPEEEQENFVADETEEPSGEEPETETADVFSEQEIVGAEEETLEEPSDEAVAGQAPEATSLPTEEIETEGTESFSEPELVEADEPDAVLEEAEMAEEEVVDEAEAQTDADDMIEEELALEEEDAASNAPAVAAATTDEPVGKRGRKPIQDYDDDAGNLNVPPDEDLFKRQYYSMRETAAMFGVNQSLLRFWENEFKILQPKKNKKGDRYFRPVDVKNLVLIHHLLRVRKFTMEGAKEYLQSNKKAGDAFELGKRLEKLKSFLLELKASL